MSNFRGHHEHTIDEKTRVFIPAKLREEFGGEAVICRPLNGKKCVYIFTNESWNTFVENSKMLYEGEDRLDFQTYINSTMNEVPVDKQGRVTIGQTLMDYAGLERDVTLVGAGSHLQVWDRDTLEDAVNVGINKFDASKLSYE